MESKERTTQEFINLDTVIKGLLPGPSLVLIEKDKALDTWGGLHIPKSTQERMLKFSGTGIIRKKSLMGCETDHEKYLMDKYQEGDHVAFVATTPVNAPLPPYFRFKNQDDFFQLVYINIADVLGMVAIGEDKLLEDYQERFLNA